MQLTSQYCRGVRGADTAALDAEGRDWYFYRERMDSDCPDQDVPEWPACMVCGVGIDWPEGEPHWFQPDLHAFLHEGCMVLSYPPRDAICS